MQPGNPFSTRYVRPGKLAFQFHDARGADRLIERLERNQWWGQILGPHGSGKSTLLHALVPILKSKGRTVLWHTLHNQQRRLPSDVLADARDWQATTQLIIDGYEQLGWLARRALKRRCRRAGAGLLVTTHQPVGFPTLIDLNCSVETARQLASQLMSQSQISISAHEIDQIYAAHNGNIRELFFELYDVYERRGSD